MPLWLAIVLGVFFGLFFVWANIAIQFTRPDTEPKNIAGWMTKRRIIIGLVAEAIGVGIYVALILILGVK